MEDPRTDQVNTDESGQHTTAAIALPELPTIQISQQMIPIDNQWQTSVMEDIGLSPNTEFPWSFQDGGIFGLTSGLYNDVAQCGHLQPFADNYDQIPSNASLVHAEIVSISIISCVNILLEFPPGL